MGDFFGDGFPHILSWMLGSLLLGAVLVYGVVKSGKLSRGERRRLDDATARRQRSEDPQKS